MELEPNQEKRQKPNVLVTGTPGVGKTTFSKLCAEYIEGFQFINLGEVINQNKLYKEWNNEFDVPEFDEDLVVDFLEPHMQKGGIILEFHSSDFFPQRWFDIIVLLRCNNTQLYDRLAQRGYNEKKITVNIECEIMEVTSEEVYDSYDHDKIMELQNSVESDVQKNMEILFESIKKWKTLNS